MNTRAGTEASMGAGESATRKVSFGLDEDDRVRVLHGVKVSSAVLSVARELAALEIPGYID
ncbi:hypothetical protein Z043_101328 [Scleropages formosus]|uniref:Uncharacterized protein n=1 Tax=Scleropages formosus TaxID=113540 RepID=A0A0P7ZDK4_SCLFO|nr:hypothetical protein Z043_101328 [Scleropages formosus]